MTRIAFLGSPEVATVPLRALVAAGYEVGPVITKTDKRRGRNATVTPSPVKAAALELGLEVSEQIDVGDADVALVAAFGRLIPGDLVRSHDFVNIHPSLLPRWRGAAPVERAILAGDKRTGVCLMSLVEEMDAGPVFSRVETDIADRETASELLHRLFGLGTELLLDALANGFGEPVEQVGEKTRAEKLTTADLRLDWANKTAAELDCIVRIGRAWTTFRGKRLIVLDAEPGDTVDLEPGEISGNCFEGIVVGTASGSLRLLQLQPEGKGPVDAQAWLHGARITTGERLGSTP